MRTREVYALLLKPLCAVGFVGVVVHVLAPPRPFQASGILEAALLHILLATLCLSFCLLESRGANLAAKHGGIGLLAGFLIGMLFAGLMIDIPSLKDRPVLFSALALLVALLGAVVGVIFGLGVGLVRRLVAKLLGAPVNPANGEPHEHNRGDRYTGVLARRRIVQFTVLGIGLPAIFFLCVKSHPVIDTRGIEESLRVGSEAETELAQPIRSTGQIWQAQGINAIAFSCDGKHLATAGQDGAIGIWNTADWTRAGQIKQEGSVARLAFSPDNRWLYVAGEDGRDPILCRFAWRTGNRDKTFAGHKKRVDGMALSADGKTLITSSFLEDVLNVWDTTTGTIVHGFRCSSPRFAYAPQKACIIQWRAVGPGYARAYLDGAQVPGFWFPGKPMAVAFGSDEQFLFVAKHEYSQTGGCEISLSVYRFDDVYSVMRGLVNGDRVTGGWGHRFDHAYQVLAQTRLPSVWDDEVALAVSPDGRQVAVASGDVRLAIYAMPGLKSIKSFRFPCHGTRSQRIHQVAFSPDGRWLAAGRGGRTTPRLFDVATGEERTLNEGHGDRVLDLRFAADGRTLRSVGNDGTVCVWDAATMKMLRRLSLPAGCLVGDIRPSDGQYALCSDAIDPKRPVQVVDLHTGKPICEANLPFSWKQSDLPDEVARARRVYWLSDQEALCIGYFIHSRTGASHHWWRFNYRTGKILAEGDPRNIAPQRVGVGLWPDAAIINALGEVTEDGSHLFLVGGGGKGSPPSVAGRINLRTFRATGLGSIDRPVNGDFGLVPGGKYFHLGLHVYDRRSLNLVAAKDFPNDHVQVGLVTFSPDGSRYAAMLWPLRQDARPKAIVFVHETIARCMLLAFASPTAVARFRFSQDGTQLAIAYDDGTLELRSIPVARSERPAARQGLR